MVGSAFKCERAYHEGAGGKIRAVIRRIESYQYNGDRAEKCEACGYQEES